MNDARDESVAGEERAVGRSVEEPHACFVREARVAPSPGADFGPAGRGCVRVNFATSREILTEILERMAGAIARR